MPSHSKLQQINLAVMLFCIIRVVVFGTRFIRVNVGGYMRYAPGSSCVEEDLFDRREKMSPPLGRRVNEDL